MRSRLSAIVLLPVLVFALALSPSVRSQEIDREQVKAIAERVATLRGLEPRGEMDVAIVDRQTFREHLVANAEDATNLVMISKLTRVLGRTPPDVEVLGEEVQAAYDSDEKQVALPVGELDARAKFILSHELTHALQDQHFGLDGLIPREPRNGDRDLAVRALVEGDATLTSRIYASLSLSADELRSLRDSGESLGSPMLYRLGTDFAQVLLNEGGWEMVNAAYGQPPQSTAQVMHPRKYLAQEAPLLPVLAEAVAALGPGWQLLREDTLGELQLQSILGQSLPPYMAMQGAAGWGGDRYLLLERAADGFLGLVLKTNWDSSREAQEFFTAYADSVVARYASGAVLLKAEPRLKAWSTPQGVVWLEGGERQVLLVIAPEPREAERLAAAARQ